MKITDRLMARVSVESLDDERWTNIERRVVIGAGDVASVPHRTPSRTPLLVGAAAVVAIVAVLAGVIGHRLAATNPQVAQPSAAEPPLVVEERGDGSTIDIGDARITSTRGASFAVTRPDGGVLVALARGKVELAVAKRAGRPPLIVRASDTDVVVVGTEFSVDRDGDLVDVRVTEGVVRVVRNHQSIAVAAGQGWQTDRGRHELATAVVAQREAGLDNTSLPAPAAAKPPENSAAVLRPSARSQPAVVSEKPAALDSPSDPYYDLKTAIRRATVLRPADAGASDPVAAIAKYREAATTGDGASHALYSIAYVQYLRLGRSDDALQTLERYRQRFEGGAEYGAALWLRVRILCLASFDEACRAAAHTYIASGDDPKLRDIAERVTSTAR